MVIQKYTFIYFALVTRLAKLTSSALIVCLKEYLHVSGI